MAKAITSYITGPVLYANVFERNKITPKISEYAPEGGQYSIMIGVDKATARKIKGWSKMHKSRSVDDYEDGEAPDGMVEGLDYFTFKRNHLNPYRDDWVGPPTVVDAEGLPFDSTVNIGNGSDCTVKISIYQGVSKAGQAYSRITLEAVRVNDLVEYEGATATEYEEDIPDDVIPF